MRMFTACGFIGIALLVAAAPENPPPAPPEDAPTPEAAPDTPAPAPKSPGTAALPEVTVTATRSPAEPFNVPYAVDILDNATLADNQARTVPESLKETPGIHVQKTAQGHGSPILRGFTGNRNVFLIDGIRLNNSCWRDGPVQYWNTVDPYLVDRIEIVRG
ncbi:MAG: Plug domain-containing protein, partial [Planctomycetota bacterium]